MSPFRFRQWLSHREKLKSLNSLAISCKFKRIIIKLHILVNTIFIRKSSLNDDYRASDAHKDGGFAFDDQAILAKYRSALKDLIKQVGRMIISGNFEVYKVSFPIRCMSSRSILTAVARLSPVLTRSSAQVSDHFLDLVLLLRTHF